MHLESLARMGDIEARAELESVTALPPLGAYLWNYFCQLHATRVGNGMGPTRLTRAEIRLWQEDEGVDLQRWERRAIMAIDAAWLAAQAQSMASRTAAASKPPS